MIIIYLIKSRWWKHYFAITEIEISKPEKKIMLWKGKKGKIPDKENSYKEKFWKEISSVLLTMTHNVSHLQVCADF